MQIKGTAQEIEWVRRTLLNQCINCPYGDSCDRRAKEEFKKYGEVKFSCKEYIEENIDFLVMKEP